MIPIDSQVSRSKVKGQAYSSYVVEGGICVLQTAIFLEILFQNLWNNSARLKHFTNLKQHFINKQTVEKELFIHIIEICCDSGILVKSYRYWLLNWQP